ncbi:SubName: Full=Uncharacterized protein {ECO:0000313/EMBL:CCA69434.1} [Serendipita indica DSM 11827]|uniref:Uncharacterized protein n=1 Tax=Serendipita indica (strain DSM 11827) TaxID=1109443 RepID=G4TDP1_SERID|nr:SubName: Full=Uncharacterized protein {ECO:0000313/EMBL:CCA69434.1} [Serendipita indica DSM 11827]CCA69434.1 hypothetical protein PIIN_03334 [Serendipita indica DSM 11827]
MATQTPPFYILISQSSPGRPVSLAHPTVQLHYADDPPTALLPTAEHPNILILEPSMHIQETSTSVFQSSSPPSATGNSTATITPSSNNHQAPVVHSLSPNLAVTAVRVAQPPAAAVAYATAHGHDPSIYIIDYVPLKYEEPQRIEDSMLRDTQSTAAMLAQFHQKNALIRRVLDSTTTSRPPHNLSSP